MEVRKPAVAGQFYNDNRDLCLGELQESSHSSIVPLLHGLQSHLGGRDAGDGCRDLFEGGEIVLVGSPDLCGNLVPHLLDSDEGVLDLELCPLDGMSGGELVEHGDGDVQ